MSIERPSAATNGGANASNYRAASCRSPVLRPPGITTLLSLLPSSGHKLVTSGKRFKATVGRRAAAPDDRLPAACSPSPPGCLPPPPLRPGKIEHLRRSNQGLPLQIKTYSCGPLRWTATRNRHSLRRILMRDHFPDGAASGPERNEVRMTEL